MTSLQQSLKQTFPELAFQFDFPLASQTYFKVGGLADVYLETSARDQFIELVKYCREQKIPLTILGGASNVIISDKGIRGLVVKLTNDTFEVGDQMGDLTLVRIGAGMKTALAVRQTVDAGLTGLEFFLGVPGNLGGAIYNNAHYLADLIGEHVNRVEVIDSSGEAHWLEKEECHFGYDSSRFQQSDEVIWQIEFALAKGNSEASQLKIREATLYRAQTQPLGLPSSGCIFQNAPNTDELKKRFPQFAERTHVPGGFLIDQAGLKGQREGDIEVSDKHAAFFVNKGQGKAKDITTLIEKVKDTVRSKFGVELKAEVFWLGEK